MLILKEVQYMIKIQHKLGQYEMNPKYTKLEVLGQSEPQLQAGACLTLSFMPLGHSDCVTQATVQCYIQIL